MNQLPETASDRRAKQRSFTLLCALSCAVRLICSVSVVLQDFGTAAWIAALLGTLMTLPALLLFLMCIRLSLSVRPGKLLSALFFLIFSFDCSAWLYSLAQSASCTIQGNVDILWLYLPALAVAAIIAARGTNACGGLARAACAICAALMGIAFLCLLDEMQPIFLTPVLGPGIGIVTKGSVTCAGYAALYPAGIWIFASHTPVAIEKPQQNRMLRGIFWAMLWSVVFLLLYGMLAPNMPSAPQIRIFALERLLTGGGHRTSVHFPSLLSWYALLLCAGVFSLFCAKKCTKILFPARGTLFCTLVSTVCAIAWTPIRMYWDRCEEWIMLAALVIVNIAAIIFAARTLIERRKRRAHD